MKKTLLLFFILFSFFSTQAQNNNIWISGNITDDSGAGIPGINVYVKNSTTGTVTGIDGSYRLYVPENAIIVVTGVGYSKKEFYASDLAEELQNMNLDLPQPKHNMKEYADSTGKLPKHIATMKDKNQAKYKGQNNSYYREFHNIDNIKYNKITNRFNIILQKDLPEGKPLLGRYKMAWSSAVQFSRVNKLPDLQTQFAQGRPILGENTWQGAENNEIFSWGPALQSLVYDGNASYAYDTRGSLVSQSSNPNSNVAQSSDQNDFFRTGQQLYNQIKVHYELPKFEYLFSIEHQNQIGILNENQSDYTTLTLNLTQDIRKIKLREKILFTQNNYSLPQLANNWQQIVGAVWRTPPSFDNTFQQVRKSALENSSVYRLGNNTPRSHSPTNIDNPFGLVNTLPDSQESRHFLAQVELKNENYAKNILYTINLAYQNQYNNKILGLPNIPNFEQSSRLSTRTHNLNDFFANMSLWKDIKTYLKVFDSYMKLKLNLGYIFHYETQEVNRQNISPDQSIFEDNINLSPNRLTNLLRFEVESYTDLLSLKFSNHFYFSSTLKPEQYGYWQPRTEVKFQLNELLNIYNFQLDIIGSYQRSINETPILYDSWQYNSLFYDAENYGQYFESQELSPIQGLNPERKQSLNLGLYFAYPRYYRRVNANFSINYFKDVTKDLILPIQNSNTFELQNTATILNQGLETSASLRLWFSINAHNYQQGFWKTDFHFTSFRPVVKSVNNNFGQVPLAGYQDINTSLIEGQPFPVIVGTRYLRDDSGQIIIDNEGFPLVEETPQVIGNPNPDWILNWNNTLKIWAFSLSIITEYRKGGQIWNGTQNALNYFGVSQLSAEQRNTQNFIFEGVLENGNINNIAVDFANPANGLEGNRWVRYGFAGVGEEAIQDASSWRIQKIELSFNGSKLFQKLIKHNGELHLGFFVGNILLKSNYSGIDPNTRLMNYNFGTGLDLFNLPNTTNFGLNIQIKI